MIWWKPKWFIDTYWSLEPRQRKILRKMWSKRRREHFINARLLHPWRELLDCILAGVLLLAVVELLMTIIWLIGKGIGY